MEINKTAVIAVKPLIKIKDLTADNVCPINKAKIVATKFGEAVLPELEESNYFLSKRVTYAFRSQIVKFSAKKYGSVKFEIKELELRIIEKTQ